MVLQVRLLLLLMKNTYILNYKVNFSLFTPQTKGTLYTSIHYKPLDIFVSNRLTHISNFNYTFTRNYHNSKFHLHLEGLYAANQGRKLPLKPFEEKPLDVCKVLAEKETLYKFFKQFAGKGGIYKFTLISKPNIFYIGSTANFYIRFKQHT